MTTGTRGCSNAWGLRVAATWLTVGIVFVGVASWLPQAFATLTAGPGIESMEGNMLDLGLRVLGGENPYPDPVTDSATAYQYPPIAPVLLGTAWLAGGETMLAPRLLSLTALIATAVLIGGLILQKGGWGAALACGAAWIAIQPLFWDFMILARVDALAMMFTVATLIAGDRYLDGRASAWPAALLSVIAVYTKQTAFIAPLAILIALAARRAWGKAFVLSVLSVIPGLVIAALLHFWSNGWSTASLLLSSHHPLFWNKVAIAASFHFLSGHGLLLTVLALLGAWRLGARPLVWAWALSLPLGILSAAKLGGLYNSLAPATCLGLPLAFANLHTSTAHAADTKSQVVRWVLLLALTVLLVSTARSSFSGWVGPGHGALVSRTRTLIGETQGPIFMARFQDFLLDAGRPVHDDLYVAFDFSTAGYPVLHRIIDAVETERYERIFTHSRDIIADWGERARAGGRPEVAELLDEFLEALQAHYELERTDTYLPAFRRKGAAASPDTTSGEEADDSRQNGKRSTQAVGGAEAAVPAAVDRRLGLTAFLAASLWGSRPVLHPRDVVHT